MNRALWSFALFLTPAVVGCSDSKPAATAAQSVPSVTVAHPVHKAITEWDEYTGRFAAVATVEVRARVSGFINSIHFKDGQLVKQGDLLFVIDPRPYTLAVEQGNARAVSRAMESHLPKSVKAIVKNVPGAGSVKGITAMFRAAPDGYTIGMVDLPGAVAPAVVGEQLPYELDDVTWLGVVNIGVYSLVIAKNSTFPTLDAFRNPTGRLPFFATTGSNDLAMAKIVARTLQVKAQFLTSYTGGPATHLAIIRGDADAGLGIDVAIAKHLASGDLKQLV